MNYPRSRRLLLQILPHRVGAHLPHFRLDGRSRPHESIVRRVLVGEAGKRTQGLLAKLGVTQSYVIINTFLYSVYGSINATAAKNAALIAYRNSWLDAVTKGKKIEAVIALGGAADSAWKTWTKTTTGKTFCA